jgi:hypothetical protein
MSYSAGKVVHPRLAIIPVSFGLHCPWGTMHYWFADFPQCCGSGSGLCPDSIGSLIRIRNPDLDPVGQKLPRKI